METRKFNSNPLTSKSVLFVFLGACLVGGFAFGLSIEEHKAKSDDIRAGDYVSRAKGVIRALYPDLDPPPHMIVMDGRDWDDTGVTNVFDLELCNLTANQE